jgi:hypothetical protein
MMLGAAVAVQRPPQNPTSYHAKDGSRAGCSHAPIRWRKTKKKSGRGGRSCCTASPRSRCEHHLHPNGLQHKKPIHETANTCGLHGGFRGVQRRAALTGSTTSAGLMVDGGAFSRPGFSWASALAAKAEESPITAARLTSTICAQSTQAHPRAVERPNSGIDTGPGTRISSLLLCVVQTLGFWAVQVRQAAQASRSCNKIAKGRTVTE